MWKALLQLLEQVNRKTPMLSKDDTQRKSPQPRAQTEQQFRGGGVMTKEEGTRKIKEEMAQF